MYSVNERMAFELGIPEEAVAFALGSAHASVKKIRIPKKSGGKRVLLQPAIETKMLQSWIALRILSKLPVSESATAFERGASIIKNATAHSSALYSVRIDLEDFFPSIKFDDLKLVIRSNCTLVPVWAVDEDALEVINRVCFDSKSKLPAGYPTSPHIANCVLHELDERLRALIESQRDRFGTAAITRYADDFTFSTDKRGGCSEFVIELDRLLATTTSPRLRINQSKTRFMSRMGGSTLITGLRIRQDTTIGIHANYRDHVRLMLKLYASERLRVSDVPRLRGHLAFIEAADPRLFTKLSFQYFSEIERIRTERIPVESSALGSDVAPLAKAA